MPPDVLTDVAYRTNRATVCTETGWTYRQFEEHEPHEISELLTVWRAKAAIANDE